MNDDEATGASTEWTFDGARGAIVARRWRGAEHPRYLAVVVHGYGEHIGRYEWVAARLAEHGAIVHGLDHLGHGKSAGERALVEDFEAVVDDLHTVVTSARASRPDLPVVLIGHSMGGLIAARYAQRHNDELTALVLSGPVIGELAFVDALLALDDIPDDPLDVSTLSRDSGVGERYAADPLVWHGPFKRATLQALRTTLDVIGDAGSIGELPLLWLHGADDQLVPIEGSRTGIGRLRGERFEERAYDGARHEIFNEVNADEVVADVTAFVDGVLAGDRVPDPPVSSAG